MCQLIDLLIEFDVALKHRVDSALVVHLYHCNLVHFGLGFHVNSDFLGVKAVKDSLCSVNLKLARSLLFFVLDVLDYAEVFGHLTLTVQRQSVRVQLRVL